MVTEAQAASTYAAARAFYKGGAKSSNKSYYGTGSFNAKTVGVDEDRQLDDSQAARNRQVLQNCADMAKDGRAKKYSGKTPFEIGEALVAQNNTCGNCGEMAAVAIYLAIQKFAVPAADVSMWTMTNEKKSWFSATRTFGHSVAVLGKGKLHERWVVDPWAGVVCKADAYKAELGTKLAAWTGEGKRIAAGGCWVEPTNEMVTGVLEKKAKFSEVEANEPGK